MSRRQSNKTEQKPNGNGESNQRNNNKPHNSGNSRRKKNCAKKQSADNNAQRSETNAIMSHKDYDNDPSYYFENPMLMEQATDMAFNQFLGVPFDVDSNISSGSVEVPTIAVLHMLPSPGVTTSLQSGINQAGFQNYIGFSSINSKTTNYAPQDLSILELALGDIISVAEHIRRAFGVAFDVNQRNRSVPYALLSAMQVEPLDFTKNIANYRMRFNSIITTINKVPFVRNIGYFAKCESMYEKVYTDSDSSMAQLIFMIPALTWTYQDDYNDQGGGLVASWTAGSLTTMGDWLDRLSNMIEGLMTSSLFNFIYSDVLNYSDKYGVEMFYLDYLREDYVILPEYNKNFLLQFHNVSLVPKVTLASWNVSCNVNKNMIDFNPTFSGDTMTSLIVDFDVPTPLVGDKVDATRYLVSFEGSNPAFLPDHVCNDITIYRVSRTTAIQTSTYNATTSPISPDIMSALSQFDWAPLMYSISNENGTCDIVGDLNYFTTLDPKWFKGVNDLAMQGLFVIRTKDVVWKKRS